MVSAISNLEIDTVGLMLVMVTSALLVLVSPSLSVTFKVTFPWKSSP